MFHNLFWGYEFFLFGRRLQILKKSSLSALKLINTIFFTRHEIDKEEPL